MHLDRGKCNGFYAFCIVMEELGHLIWATRLSVVEIRVNGLDGQEDSCGGLTLAGCEVPTQLLSHSPSSTGQGGKQHEKIWG